MATKYGLLMNNIGNFDSDELREKISVNAFYRAEKRGFESGHELEDWLEAEREITGQYRHGTREPAS